MNLLFQNDTQGQYPDSWYQASTRLPPVHPPIDGDQQCDVVIIGAGYTGLSTALYLAQNGVSTILLDAHRIGWGASGRNGGQVGSGFNIDQSDLATMVGEMTARELWTLCENAKENVRTVISNSEMNCDLREGIAFAHWKARAKTGLLKYRDHMEKHYGYNEYSFLEKEQVEELIGSQAYPIALLDRGASHLHPLKFSLALAKLATEAGATIFENTLATDILIGDTPTVKTASGNIKADTIVLACNGYLQSLETTTAQRVMPINNFMIATEPLDGLALKDAVLPQNCAVFDSKFVVNYYKLSSDNRLLFGGGENYGYQFPANIESMVKKPMLKIFPQLADAKIDYAWGGTLAITANRLPCFRNVSPNIISASGYSGHGVALASYAGQVIGGAILGDRTELDLLGKLPTRRFPGGEIFRNALQRSAMTFGALLDRLP